MKICCFGHIAQNKQFNVGHISLKTEKQEEAENEKRRKAGFCHCESLIFFAGWRMKMEESARIALGQLEVEKRRGRWWRRGQSDNQGGKKRIGEMEDNRREGEMEDKCGKTAARSHADAPWEPEHCNSSFTESVH